MSVVFVIGSEETLRGGTPWCMRIAQRTGHPIHVLVLGTETKVLQGHARSALAKKLECAPEKVSVQSIESDRQAILDFAIEQECTTLLLMTDSHDCDLQESVFAKSPFRSILLRSSGKLPTSEEDISLAEKADENFLGSIEYILGFRPKDVFCEDDLDIKEFGRQVRYGMELHDEASDLLLVHIKQPSKSNPAYKVGLELLEEHGVSSVALLRGGESLTRSLASRFRRWVASIAPPMQREERLTLAKDLEFGSTPNLEFLGLISAAAMLAAFGLLQDSAAVIIGAMLIAPLMTPILGAGLALTHGNRKLFKSALLTIGLGFVGALGASILFGFLVFMVRPVEDHINWVTPEMWARCRPSPLDFCVGLVGGLAAAYARTREHLSAALAGAAIAAALVPPISTAGLQIAFGLWGSHPKGIMVIGPILLVSVNVLTITIGASFVLWARGMRVDREPNTHDKWVMRVIAVLLLLALAALVISVRPSMIFPAEQVTG